MVPSQLNHFIGKTAKLAVRTGNLSGKERARRSTDGRRINVRWKGEGGVCLNFEEKNRISLAFDNPKLPMGFLEKKIS